MRLSKHRAFFHLIWAATAALFISGCADLPPAKSGTETATRAAVVAQVQADAAERVATQLLDAGVIDSKTGEKVYAAAADVRAAVSAARMALGQNQPPQNALSMLQAARTSLGILRAFLASQE